MGAARSDDAEGLPGEAAGALQEQARVPLNFPTVAIGASAGGLDALSRFVLSGTGADGSLGLRDIAAGGRRPIAEPGRDPRSRVPPPAPVDLTDSADPYYHGIAMALTGRAA